MKAPIIVFTDDTDVFERPERVTSYFEPWIVNEKCEAIDSEGKVLKLVVKTEKKKLLGIFPYNEETLYLQETDDFKRDEFKSKVIAFLEVLLTSSPDISKAKPSSLSHLSLEELIKILIEVKGFTK